MGFLRDPEKLISALLTPRVWDWCEMGSVLEKYLFLLGSQRGGITDQSKRISRLLDSGNSKCSGSTSDQLTWSAILASRPNLRGYPKLMRKELGPINP
jgi:hypothetical protein